ncbi:MAG: NAD(P)/FAD-dependent oxidoreductase [Chloroflexi bacterium]|nr:NAD(P)/FAD-dependent oxidoreductase [Chloroflexota bacterium]
MTAGPKKARILVLGGGFGGVYTTLHLERALRRDPGVELTLVSEENFFLFTPFLHEVATGGIETRHIAHPIRKLRGRKRFSFLLGEVQAIDLAAKQVHTDHGSLGYDFLVLALGSATRMDGLEGPKETVFTLKSLRDGILLRNHIIEMFERADAEPELERQRPYTTFVIAGGGYTGVQLAAEMRDFIRHSLLKHYRQVKGYHILLVQDGDSILAGMERGLAEAAHRTLVSLGVEVRLGARVTRVAADWAEVEGQGRVPTRTLVWATGVVARPVVAALPLPQDESGRIVVNDFLEVPGQEGLYALGDNACLTDPQTGQAAPPRAHVAVRQARVVAANIVAKLRGRPPRPFRYSLGGELVALGSRSAVAHVYGWRVRGLLARLIWLVGYTAIMKGRYNRLRVVLDWLLALIFGRDSTLLRVR